MNKKELIVFGVFMLFVLILAIVAMAFTASMINNIGTPSSDQKYTYSCDVSVSNNVVTGPSITKYTCSNTGSKCGSMFGMLSILNPFSAKGNVELWNSQGLLSSKSWETGMFGSVYGNAQVTIKGCTKPDTLTLKLINDKGDVVQTKVV